MCLEGLLHGSNGGKAKNVTDACVCAFPLGIYRTALSIQGKDGQEPGQDLLPFSDDVAVCTKHGGVRKSIVLGLFPFQILRGFA